MSPKQGYQAGIAKASEMERLAWSLKGAPLRRRDLMLTAIGAIAEGRKLRDSITRKMTKLTMDPEDAMVEILFAKPDLSGIRLRPVAVPVLPSAASELEAASTHAESLPIGFLVAMWDRDVPGTSDGMVWVHPRPLIVEDPRSLRINGLAAVIREKEILQTLIAARKAGTLYPQK